MLIGRETIRTWGTGAVVLAALGALGLGGCDRGRRSEPVDRTTTTAAEVERPTDEEEVRADAGVAADEDASAEDGGVAEEEPRGAERYSIIAAPDLERNLGITDAGPNAREAMTAPAAPPAEEPPPARRPSAADRIPWSGSTGAGAR